MHRPVFLITAGSVAACGALIFATALPAGAATSARAETMALSQNGPGASEDTPVTFTVSSIGVLGITVPAGADLGPAVAGFTLGSPGNFGAVTVTDTRGLDPASWTASVSSTDFLNTSTTNLADTIPVQDATYITGPVTAANGLGSTATVLNATLTLDGSAQDVVTETGFDGDNSANWTPEIAVNVPPNAVVGTYTGTVTHSVS
jgi:hypothetical protein